MPHTGIDCVVKFNIICDDVFRPYFEEKARYNALLDAQKTRIQALEREVSAAKLTYGQALRNLERISDEIHRLRSKCQEHSHQRLNGEGNIDDVYLFTTVFIRG